jgi:hypothetical protein
MTVRGVCRCRSGGGQQLRELRAPAACGLKCRRDTYRNPQNKAARKWRSCGVVLQKAAPCQLLLPSVFSLH